MKVSGVYCIRNKVNDKRYVGSGSVISQRWYDHKYLLVRKRHHSPHLQSAWDKYGASNFAFEVLEPCSLSDLFSFEQKWIDYYHADDPESGYNVCSVAGSRLGVKSPQVAEANRKRVFTEEDRQRLSSQAKKPRGETTRAAISLAKKRWWESEKNRKAASERTRKQWEDRKLVSKALPNPLSVYEFGERLLITNDLDPVYVMLWEARLDPDTLQGWLLAYFCFYHSGTASWIVDSGGTESDYWRRMREAAASKSYPRCSERRHFRGKLAISSVDWLAERGVRKLFAPILGEEHEASRLVAYVMTWRGFGPWIAFKVADMVERLDIARVTFDNKTILYDSPREAAERLYPGDKDAGEKALKSISVHLSARRAHGEAKPGYLAPPRYERAVGAQEIETILCKWGSYLKGHYEIGEDIASLRKALLRFARVPLSQKLLKAGAKGRLW